MLLSEYKIPVSGYIPNCRSGKRFGKTQTTTRPRLVSPPTEIRSNNLKCTPLIFILLPLIIMISAGACNHNKTAASGKLIEGKQYYTCSMHPEIIKDLSGNCPVCGMTLVKKIENGKQLDGPGLKDLLKPTNEFVISSVPVTTIQYKSEDIQIEAIGNIQNDTRQTGVISAKVPGRIEKLYVRYRYQMIEQGQKIMDIYSPDVATAQQNLLFLLKSDPSNASVIAAAKQRLLLMGMNTRQLDQLIKTQKASLTLSVYSNTMGHIHESGDENMNAAGGMQAASATLPLSFREGMYVTTGQRIFSITDPHRSWAVLNIFPENQYLVKAGNSVKLTPEAMPQKTVNAKINFIEPLYREGSKTLTARVYFDNSALNIPIGSQVRAVISGNSVNANWLPREAVVSLGISNIVFVKTNNGFVARKIQTGMRHHNTVQVTGGLSATDSVATNAQYLADSESFIKVK